MLKSYDLLKKVLNDIENNLKEEIDEETLAKKNNLSTGHLRRIFRFAFGRNIGAYIRSRKLAASVWDLLYTDKNILDIALDYGLDYEQSYIRAFKREYSLTPGDLRKTGRIIKITPPLQLFDSNKLGDGLVFGPDIVMVPEFHVVGKKYKCQFRDSLALPPEKRKAFMAESLAIPNVVNRDMFTNLNWEAGPDDDYFWYMPGVQVRDLRRVPAGYDHFTFPASLCARFRFIGPPYTEINMISAGGMFRAIEDFITGGHQEYFVENKKINIDRFDLSAAGDSYCQWEWFAPVAKKTINHIPEIPDGIAEIKVQERPPLRFIGKKAGKAPSISYEKIMESLDNWRLLNMFAPLEKLFGKEKKPAQEGGEAYICLIGKKYRKLNEYWFGMFLPKGTPAPEGYEAIDFPKTTLAACAVYGKRSAIINYDRECRKKMTDEKISGVENAMNNEWSFLRFGWRSYFEEDIYGKGKLDYCYFLSPSNVLSS